MPVAIIVARPPVTTANGALINPATIPASTSPSCGPP